MNEEEKEQFEELKMESDIDRVTMDNMLSMIEHLGKEIKELKTKVEIYEMVK